MPIVRNAGNGFISPISAIIATSIIARIIAFLSVMTAGISMNGRDGVHQPVLPRNTGKAK
jgi:hypothetical protein